MDPMSKVFPRVTKCTFQKYGPSGTVQNHDAQVCSFLVVRLYKSLIQRLIK